MTLAIIEYVGIIVGVLSLIALIVSAYRLSTTHFKIRWLGIFLISLVILMNVLFSSAFSTTDQNLIIRLTNLGVDSLLDEVNRSITDFYE